MRSLTSLSPASWFMRSMPGSHLTGTGKPLGMMLERVVPKTVVPARATYCRTRLAPRPRVAPTMRTVDVDIGGR